MPQRLSRTGSELFIVDNSEEEWKVLRYLHDWCQLSKPIDVATGYFEIGSLLALKDEWKKVEKLRAVAQAIDEPLGLLAVRPRSGLEAFAAQQDQLAQDAGRGLGVELHTPEFSADAERLDRRAEVSPAATDSSANQPVGAAPLPREALIGPRLPCNRRRFDPTC